MAKVRWDIAGKKMSFILAVILVLMLTASCSTFTTVEPVPDEAQASVVAPHKPISDTGAFVMNTDYYPPSTSPQPAKCLAFKDPNFGTMIRRITDKKSDAYSDPGIQNEYSKFDPENSNGTLVILRGNDARYYLYNPLSCQLIRRITDFDANSYAEPEPRWDPVSPGIFYYSCNTELRRYDVDTASSAVLHDFGKDFPKAALITTKMEGDASLDRRFWCFMVADPSWNLLAVICYDRLLDKIVGQKTDGFPDQINWVGMSMSGNYCIVGYEDAVTYTQVFSRDFKSVRNLPDGSAGHGDAALTMDGRDVYVYQNIRTDCIAMADMDSGAETKLLQIPFDINSDIGLHISGNCAQTAGWVLVSTYGAKNPPPGEKHSWMDCQLFMLELKSSPRIWRIASTQSYTSPGHTGDKNYFAECFASINTRGTKIYFGSNWGNFARDYTETYQAELNEAWISNLR